MNRNVCGEMTLTECYELIFISEDKRDPHTAAGKKKVSVEAEEVEEWKKLSPAHAQPEIMFDDV